MNYYKECFNKYLDFEGRASREEFWYFFIINIIILSVLSFIEQTYHILLFSGLFGLIITPPTISAAVRRLHDVGKSGWRLLLLIIPFFGLVILLITLAMRSKEENAYGLPAEEARKSEFTPLMQASAVGDLEHVKKLISSGVDVNIKDGTGKTAMMYAIENNHMEVVEELIKAGAE
jgi:uncharacterized membrane protein YhaH (DUF805 family)